LGEARREDYAKIVLGYLGFGEKSISVGDWPTGKKLPVKQVQPVRHRMLEGSTGGILYGDPAYRPYPAMKDVNPITTTVTRVDDELRIDLSVRAREVFLWCADPFRQFDPETRTMAMKAYTRVELPTGFPEVGGVRVESASWGGTAMNTMPVIWAEETDRGRRYLHVKPGWARESRRGPIAITLVAGPGKSATTPAAKPRDQDWLERAREAGDYVLANLDKLEGENVYNGAAGVALFLFELHTATGEKRWL
ncbi:MAG: hypothetical protein GY704_11565, partial [Phycisphaeraceae bacterium]|nr:hypothetical protein [Phycisphaeraceae bacterium]